MQKKRRWWIACLISIFCPGLGQIYNGNGARGASILVLSFLFSALMLVFGAKSFYIGLLLFLCAAGTYLFALFDSARTAAGSETELLKRYQRWYFYPFLYLIFVSVILVLQAYLKLHYGEAFRVPSASMAPTIKVGDYLFADKSNYVGKPPQRGDVIILRLKDDPATPADESTAVHLKRVIAIGGETVKLVGSKLFLNDKELDESSYARYQEGGWSNFDSATVPPDHVFLLGDNRDFSKDSRHWVPHFIENSQVLGIATYIYWPLERIGVTIE